MQADTPVDVYGSRAKPPKTLTKLEREAPYDEVFPAWAALSSTAEN